MEQGCELLSGWLRGAFHEEGAYAIHTQAFAFWVAVGALEERGIAEFLWFLLKSSKESFESKKSQRMVLVNRIR